MDSSGIPIIVGPIQTNFWGVNIIHALKFLRKNVIPVYFKDVCH